MVGMPVYTIGYGSRSVEELIQLLKANGVAYLVDIRTKPYSMFKPEFSRDPLSAVLARAGIKYVFLGDSLGGMPDDPESYTDGKVDYEKLGKRPFFLSGISRIRDGASKGHVMALMCSEGKPHECHRSKLVGEILTADEIDVLHIDENGKIQSQDTVIRRITGGQQDLFGNSFTSRKRYRNRDDS